MDLYNSKSKYAPPVPTTVFTQPSLSPIDFTAIEAVRHSMRQSFGLFLLLSASDVIQRFYSIPSKVS